MEFNNHQDVSQDYNGNQHLTCIQCNIRHMPHYASLCSHTHVSHVYSKLSSDFPVLSRIFLHQCWKSELCNQLECFPVNELTRAVCAVTLRQHRLTDSGTGQDTVSCHQSLTNKHDEWADHHPHQSDDHQALSESPVTSETQHNESR